jgi:hypothetical protein
VVAASIVLLVKRARMQCDDSRRYERTIFGEFGYLAWSVVVIGGIKALWRGSDGRLGRKRRRGQRGRMQNKHSHLRFKLTREFPESLIDAQNIHISSINNSYIQEP